MTDDRKPSWDDVVEAYIRGPGGHDRRAFEGGPIKLSPWQWEELLARYIPQGVGSYDFGSQLGPLYGIPVVVEEPPKAGWVRRLWWRLTDPVRAMWTGWRMRRQTPTGDDHE